MPWRTHVAAHKMLAKTIYKQKKKMSSFSHVIVRNNHNSIRIPVNSKLGAINSFFSRINNSLINKKKFDMKNFQFAFYILLLLL